ncbi:MAG: tetratricopeptide repeat protein [Gemmatimonadetes bacterium]|nr:tetratricopeptide repeat protein [Gemmatimonadota bacterium]
MKGYTTREVAEVLGLSSARILSWTRLGLIAPKRGPRGAYLFSFQDIVLLRNARALLDADVPARRVRESLEALRAQLPHGRPLSAVQLSALGDRVLVYDDTTLWDPNSGQVQMDFAATELVRDSPPVEGPAPAPADQSDGEDLIMSADDWYDSAVDLEGSAAREAIGAYQRALALDPTHSDAHLNLGRLLHEEGRVEEAEAHYREAASADPRSARALYNLGVVLEDQDLRIGAVEAYEAALRLDSDLAVAHFNLSRLLEAEGKKTEALSHLAAYKRIIDRAGLGA